MTMKNQTSVATACWQDEIKQARGVKADGSVEHFEEGERIMPEGCGECFLEFIQRGNDGVTKWWICNAGGQQIVGVWGQAKAEERCRELAATGGIAI